MISKNSIRKYIPSGITFIRIILAPFLFYAVINNFYISSIIIFLVAVSTDALDGYSARKLGTSSSPGAYFDITADFILILAGFSAFIISGTYPFGVLILIVFMFLQFLLTSKARIPIYDPVGKYYGAFLFLTIFISLITTNSTLNLLLTILIVVFTIISIISRFLFIIKRNK
jgi:phosphatidylglycerophosphate synthase